MQENTRTIDPYLMGAIVSSGRVPQVPYDLKKIKALELNEQTIPCRGETFFRCKEHDFSVISEMENLHTLILHTRNPLTVADFSFLEKCQKLKKLDLVQTNFTDCALLSRLPALTYVRLPEEDCLVNIEVLKTLRARIEFAATTTYDYPIGEIASLIKKQTRTTAYALTIQKGVESDLFDSKFGGLPYWNPHMQYPVDKRGQKMLLLAQVNFDRAAVDGRLPQQGMLQFFIALDEESYLYGYDNDAPDSQEMFRVVYHEKVDYSITPEQVQEMNIPVSTDTAIWEYTPVWKPVRVDITPKEVYINTSDKRFDKYFRSAVKSLTGKRLGRQCAWDVLTREDYLRLDEELSYDSHNMLGYPAFVQFDPRKSAKYYDTVLLQMHSEEDQDTVCWADGGVANFFINSEALAQRDFSRVYYCWDCD